MGAGSHRPARVDGQPHGWKAASGTNLFPSPHFDALNLKRSPVAPAQVCDYSTEQHHSGLRSWKWMHFPSTDSGLILAPTPRVDYVEVGPTESWFAEAWVHPKSTNSTATGSIRIGATFTDSSGVKAATDLYLDCPSMAPTWLRAVQQDQRDCGRARRDGSRGVLGQIDCRDGRSSISTSMTWFSGKKLLR